MLGRTTTNLVVRPSGTPRPRRAGCSRMTRAVRTEDRVAHGVPEVVVDPLKFFRSVSSDRHDAARPLGPRDLAVRGARGRNGGCRDPVSGSVIALTRSTARSHSARREAAAPSAVPCGSGSGAGAPSGGQRPVQRIAERLEDLLDFLPAFLGFPGSVRDPGPVRQELPENLLPLAVPFRRTPGPCGTVEGRSPAAGRGAGASPDGFRCLPVPLPKCLSGGCRRGSPQWCLLCFAARCSRCLGIKLDRRAASGRRRRPGWQT